MITLTNHKSPLFDTEKISDIFMENQKYLNSPFDFNELKMNDFFFGILDNTGETIGLCYILLDKINGEYAPFYNGCSKRGKHKEMIEAHRLLLSLAFNYFDTVYTWTPYRHAKIFNRLAKMKPFKGIDGVFYETKKDFFNQT